MSWVGSLIYLDDCSLPPPRLLAARQQQEFSAATKKRSSSSADNEATKSSLLRIDPSRIISTMIKKGGLVLDKSTRKDLMILDQVSSARSTYLDVYNKELEVRNWTVTPPNSRDAVPSLRVGRIFIKWDSYLRPCVDIQIEDVDIMVEFSNLRLTQSNWCVH
eukprot:scaffold82814_cov52-Attheya_sp.AAC.3